MGWFKRRREKRERELREAARDAATRRENVPYYGQVLTGGLYPSLYFNELGRSLSMRRDQLMYAQLSGSYGGGLSGVIPWPDGNISGIGYVNTSRQDYHPPVIESRLKCQYCGSEFLSRVLSVGNGRETKPLVELKCPNCAGAIEKE